ncbi:MAG: helix-turn-helix domain-containing protein [Muribaculaceae bacterium]|nr:helix-turn-helix domain-containing protein [Muribaculaceae bacterium]
MKEIELIDSLEAYNRALGLPTQNRFISAIDFSEIKIDYPKTPVERNFGIYGIFMKGTCGEFQYGLNKYDFNEGTLVFVGPGQITGPCTVKDRGRESDAGRPKACCGILFSPDLVAATSLSNRINDYHFFSYDSNEALHTSVAERESFMVFFRELQREIATPHDRHSLNVISSTLEALLNRCMRFYDRQFSSREPLHNDVLSRLERLLDEYFASGEAAKNGLPTVAWCAGRLCFSPNYFGDLIKRRMGITAQEYLHRRIIDEAKRLIGGSDLTFSEIAYQIGYNYPHHLSRMFKKQTGLTPNEYRQRIHSCAGA